MTTALIVRLALALAFAACIAGAYKLGDFVAERRHDSDKAEDERRAKLYAPQDSKRAWLSNLQPRPGTAGFTIAAALNGIGCLGRSAADEPVFVLCARDKTASMIVRDWARLAESLGAKREKVLDAQAMAYRMEQWRERHGGGKIPD